MNKTMQNHDLVTRAVIYAANGHAMQSRKGTNLPYIVHPAEAMAHASKLSDKPEVLAAAVLHDVIEDAGATVEGLTKEFGAHVAELVLAASEDRDPNLSADASWEVRKQHTLDYLRTVKDEDILTVCFADKLANLRALYYDYAVLGDTLWERFNQKDKKRIGWYYGGMLDVFTCFAETALYAEYKRLWSEVFGV